jgi:MscS family membrane protein
MRPWPAGPCVRLACLMRATLPFPCFRALLRLACLLLAVLFLPALAQIRNPAAPASASTPQQVLRDPLDRGTPRRAVAAFARAAQRGDVDLAVRYVQAGNRSRARAEQLAQDLATLMDRHFRQPLSMISDAPDGALDDGLALDRERVGSITAGRAELAIELVRVNDPVSGPVWLVSSETLARVPELSDADARSSLERILPAALFSRAIFDLSWADLLVWAASLLLPLLLLPPLFRLGRLLLHGFLRRPGYGDIVDAWYGATRWPATIVLTLAVNLAALSWFGPTLSFRIGYSQVLRVMLVVAVAWGVHRALSVVFGRAGMHLEGTGHTGVRSVMLLGERLLNMVILLVVFLLILGLLGFDMGTVLAGLGIIGVAVALGAQKTIENILGGMMLLGDEALAVGDLCRVNNRLGTVEDITLRSVRFRTLENTLLSIPAGVLAQADLENFATRHKFLAQHRLRLAYGTTAQQLRRIREEIAAVIDAHAQLEHPLSRIRLIEFGPMGMELEIYVHVLTRQIPQFLAIREELLLQAVAIVEAAGARFAEAMPWAEGAPPVPAR